MTYITKVISTLVLVMSSTITSPLVSADEALNSAQIKKMRFLSQALLKSRAVEKKRIEVEVQPLRAQVKEMQAALEPLAAIKFNSKSMLITKSKDSTGYIEANDLLPEGEKMQAARAGLKTKTIQIETNLNAEKQRKLANAIVKMKQSKKELEKDSPQRWQFWKKMSDKDQRQNHVLKIAGDVQSELANMEQSGELDIAKIKGLKHRLTLQRPYVPLTDIDPTFRTLIKHRK